MEIFSDMADVFNAPSDDEEFLGFRDHDAMETFSSEDSCDSLNSLESRKKEAGFPSKYVTEELRKVFTEETESETEEFKGFSNSEVQVNSKFLACRVSSEVCNDQTFPACEEEEMKTTPKRSSYALRVAFQFPSKKSVNDPSMRKKPHPSNSELPLQDNKRRKPLVSLRSTKTMNKSTEESGSDNECHKEKENSSALMKRAMNIKENKAMLAQLLAELNSMPELFPVKTPTSTPSKPKKTPRRSFSEDNIERRTNPTRNARPPENFALENFTASAVQFAEHLQRYGNRSFLKRTLSEEEREEHQRRRRSSSKYTSFRSVEDITEDDLENVAITVKDKIYDKVLGSTCHQCRQKTIDTKTVCHNGGCGGVRGQFCGPCLRNRYGEDVRSALLDPDWICPSCRGICNCSYCRKRDGRCATGMLIHLAKFYGYDNVKEYLESLQKQMSKN